jgi:ribonuclease BN (tRNA processing enzyme)
MPCPEVTELGRGDVVAGVSPWKITAAEVVHFQPQLTCYGYRLDSDEGSFVYSGDSGPCASMTTLARGADVLVHMCQYLSGTAPSPAFARACMGHLELARLGQEAQVKNLVLSHVTEQMDRPGVRERVIAEMAAIYRGNLFFGEDLMEIPLAPPAPAALM